MSYLQGLDRAQGLFLPESVEQYIAPDNPARVIDAFVDGLDLRALGFARVLPAATGRPAYAPGDLLKLYLWGYLNHVRSSRKLEVEGARNLELIWLLCGLRPDFKTIADFRRDNAEALKAVFREFVLLCRELRLVQGEAAAIDGTKLQASNHPTRRADAAQLTAWVEEIDARIAEYLAALAQSETTTTDLLGEEIAPAEVPELARKLAELRRRKESYTAALAVAEATGTKAPLTDPECLSMQKVGLGYNAQIAVDAKCHIIVAAEIADAATDYKQLPVLVAAVQEVLEKQEVIAEADAGYHDRQALVETVATGAVPCVPEPRRGDSASRGLFPKTDFVFEPEKNAYRCPVGQLLPETSQHRKRGMQMHEYSHPKACQGCPMKAQCHEGAYRRIERWEHEAIIEEIAQRITDEPHHMKRRKGLVEHCFGTIKFWRNQKALLVRGRRMVQAEWSLCALAYNLTRVINVLSVPKLLELLRARRLGLPLGTCGGALGAPKRVRTRRWRLRRVRQARGRVFDELGWKNQPCRRAWAFPGRSRGARGVFTQSLCFVTDLWSICAASARVCSVGRMGSKGMR
jgi:transposase